MASCWRLMPLQTDTGSTHMAVDTWLLDQVRRGTQPPTLRFYRWQPIAVSLGHHQRRWPAHWQQVSWQGQPLTLVRRPTGGRAVLHQGDITYAIALPIGQRRRQTLYRLLCDALIQAWQRLGVPLRYGTAGRAYHHQANCFALATAADLVTPTGYKLIGSAQLRRDHSLLQQGSMRLWPERALYRSLFGEVLESSPPPQIPPQPCEAWLETLCTLIVEAFCQQLGVCFQSQPLTTRERRLALEAAAEVVTPSPSWPRQATSALEDTPPHL